MPFLRYLRFFLFAIIPTAIMGPAIMMPEIGKIHLLPQWAMTLGSIPILLFLLPISNFRVRFALDIKTELKIRNYIWFLVMWTLYCCFSILWSANQFLAINQSLLFVFQSGLCLLIVFNLTSIKDIKSVVMLYIGVLLINYGIIYFEIFYNYHLPNLIISAAQSAERIDNIYNVGLSTVDVYTLSTGGTKAMIFGTFFNSNSLATFMELVLPLIVSNYIVKKTNIYIRLFAAALVSITLILSSYIYSRTLFIVLPLIFFIFLLLDKSLFKKIFFILIAVILSALIYVYVLPNINMTTDVSFELRKQFLTVGFERFSQRFYPLTGLGAGTFEDFAIHNFYGEILFKFGPIIFGCYLFFYFGLLRNLYRIFKTSRDRDTKYLAQGFFVTLAAYTVGCLSDSSRLLAFDSWFLISIALVLINSERIRRADEVYMKVIKK